MEKIFNPCKQDCKIRYCGQVECACNKNEIVPYLSKKGILACPPGYSNEGIKIIGKGTGKKRTDVQNVYARKCERYKTYNDEDCCFGNVDNYNGCSKDLCPDTKKCHLILSYYCINANPRHWKKCRDWVYKQNNKTKIYVFDRLCSKQFNWKTPQCQAYFKRPNKHVFEYFEGSNNHQKLMLFILLSMVIWFIIKNY